MSGKGTALITGAARRIGRRIALDLAAEGWAVAAHYKESDAEAVALADEIVRLGGQARCIRGDLRDPELAETLMSEAASKLGPVTLLVNNASCFEPDEIGSLTPQSWSKHLDVNLTAPVFLAQAMAAGLPSGLSGNIVNIVDQRVLKPNPRFFSYTTSKAALAWVTRTLAQSLAPAIRVNAIAPGPTLASARMSEEDFRRQAAATLLGRGSSPEEVSTALRFILSAPSMTGQMIALDGGQHLLWRTADMDGLPE